MDEKKKNLSRLRIDGLNSSAESHEKSSPGNDQNSFSQEIMVQQNQAKKFSQKVLAQNLVDTTIQKIDLFNRDSKSFHSSDEKGSEEQKDPFNIKNSEEDEEEESLGFIPEINETDIKIAFDTLDMKRRGYISSADLRHFLDMIGEKATDEELEEMVKFGSKNSGKDNLNFEDFINLVVFEMNPYMEGRENSKEINRTTTNGLKEIKSSNESSNEDSQSLSFEQFFEKDPNLVTKVMGADLLVQPRYLNYEQFVEFLGVESNYENEYVYNMHNSILNHPNLDLKSLKVHLYSLQDSHVPILLRSSFQVYDDEYNGFITYEEFITILKVKYLSKIDI